MEKVSMFSNAHKKDFHAFSFQLCSTANSKFSFNVSLCEIKLHQNSDNKPGF